MNWIINLLHILIIAPILGYIGWLNSTGEPLSERWSNILMLTAGLMAAAHVVFMVLKLKAEKTKNE